MNLCNYHSHCSFCDGKAPLEDFVRSAIAAGFTAYGVSSHAPLPFETRWTLKAGEVGNYLDEVHRLQVKYEGEIELYAGMEIDYLNETQHPANDYFRQLPLDYRIGSVHLIYTQEGQIIDTDTSAENFGALLEKHFAGDLKEMVKRYYEASMRMVELGGFDFIGHADKISSNAEFCRPGVTGETWYEELREALFDFIAEQGLMIEINTKVFLKKGCFFPGKEHFRQIFKRGIPIVVNSDAHLPELINAGRREALGLLKEAGFKTVRELHGGKWKDMIIE